MTVSRLRPPQQKRSILIDQVGDAWRTTIFPPATELEAHGFPLVTDFAIADEALGYAAKLASIYGWNLVDLSGKRSPAELVAAINLLNGSRPSIFSTTS